VVAVADGQTVTELKNSTRTWRITRSFADFLLVSLSDGDAIMQPLDVGQKRIFEGKHSDLSEKIIKIFDNDRKGSLHWIAR
jgi:hypothetical protein